MNCESVDPRPEVIKLFSDPDKLRMLVFLLLNVKMPTVVNSCWHFNILSRKTSILSLSGFEKS